jgi:D-alanine transaminase
MLVYLNGTYVPKERATISVDDRGFIFGDGVYEVIRARDGQLFEAAAHFERLAAGLDALEIQGLARAELQTLETIARELLERNGLVQGNGESGGASEATIYLQVTRGAAPRTHAFPRVATTPTVYLAASPFTPAVALQERGGTAITLPDVRWARCNIKTINLVPNVLAKQRAVEAGATEAIFVRDGAITDGASTNVFAVFDGEVRTPPLSTYLLPGITRRVVLDLAAESGIPVREQPVLLEELARADELFLTGTTTDVQPVCELDGRRIGAGTPGPVTRRLQSALAGRLAGLARAVAS